MIIGKYISVALITHTELQFLSYAPSLSVIVTVEVSDAPKETTAVWSVPLILAPNVSSHSNKVSSVPLTATQWEPSVGSVVPAGIVTDEPREKSPAPA